MQHVNYKLFKNGKCISDIKKFRCYSKIHNCTEYDYMLSEILIDHDNKEYKWFFLRLLLELDPTLSIYRIGNIDYLKMPYYPRGKMLFIMSILRFLNEKYFSKTPARTKLILEKYPDMDILKAITIATFPGSGWGHAITAGLPDPDQLKTVEEYRKYKFKVKCSEFISGKSYSTRNLDTMGKLETDMKNSLDSTPFLKYFNIE